MGLGDPGAGLGSTGDGSTRGQIQGWGWRIQSWYWGIRFRYRVTAVDPGATLADLGEGGAAHISWFAESKRQNLWQILGPCGLDPRWNRMELVSRVGAREDARDMILESFEAPNDPCPSIGFTHRPQAPYLPVEPNSFPCSGSTPPALLLYKTLGGEAEAITRY